MADLRILDFDIENRPLSYLGQDYTTAEITAIAACWVGKPRSMWWWLLQQSHDVSWAIKGLEGFRRLYDSADMVTGHYIRLHDLPIINGAMVEHGLAPLGFKLTCDTKLDLVKKGPVFSASQENLCAMFGLARPKIHMNTVMWREANRLTDEGLKLTAKRAIGDVVQHMALRRELVRRDLLGPPKTWSPR
jgi:hypothetical protein